MVDQPLKTFFPFFFFFTSFNKRQRQVSFHFEGKLNPLHVYCTACLLHCSECTQISFQLDSELPF